MIQNVTVCQGYNIYFTKTKRYYTNFIGDKVYGWGYNKTGYVKWIKNESRFDTYGSYVLVGRKTEVMLNRDIVERMSTVKLHRVRMPQIEWLNGPPGCGKDVSSFLAKKH